jgi:anthranilate synthase/aminodeoxychorismate synthase-like glutamine amidotransferase
MILLLDNFDSFTWNIYHYALMAGLDCKLYRSNEISMQEIKKMDPAGFIFSPGPKRPENHPLMFEILEQYHSLKPILGICLGHQAIGEYFGMELVKAPQPVHGKTSTIRHEGHEMFHKLPSSLEVTRYHSLILERAENKYLEFTSRSEDGLLMSLAHKQFPVWGMQFHPEAILTEHGLRMIENWAALFL